MAWSDAQNCAPLAGFRSEGQSIEDQLRERLELASDGPNDHKVSSQGGPSVFQERGKILGEIEQLTQKIGRMEATATKVSQLLQYHFHEFLKVFWLSGSLQIRHNHEQLLVSITGQFYYSCSHIFRNEHRMSQSFLLALLASSQVGLVVLSHCEECTVGSDRDLTSVFLESLTTGALSLRCQTIIFTNEKFDRKSISGNNSLHFEELEE